MVGTWRWRQSDIIHQHIISLIIIMMISLIHHQSDNNHDYQSDIIHHHAADPEFVQKMARVRERVQKRKRSAASSVAARRRPVGVASPTGTIQLHSPGWEEAEEEPALRGRKQLGVGLEADQDADANASKIA